MPIVKIRKNRQLSNGTNITILSSNIVLETVNIFYDYVYIPINKYITSDNTNIDSNDLYYIDL